MTPFTRLAVLAIVACAHAQYAEERAPRYIASEPKVQAPPPVAILKQINRWKPKQNRRWFNSIQTKPSKTDVSPAEIKNITVTRPLPTAFGQHLQHVMNDIPELLQRLGHNEDGSYTYGYEAGDGSFKIETKSPTGEVKGKYGYKDDTGKVRVIEYGANKYGFQPSGEGITVAPPTLVDETREENQRQSGKSQSGRNQYRPAPAQAIDYDYNDEPAPAPRPAPRPSPQYRAQPAPPPPPPQPQYRAPPPTPQPQYRPAPQPQQQYRPSQGPTPPKPAFFSGAAPSPPAEDNFFNPQPQQRQYKPKQDFRPTPQFQPQNEYTPDYNNAAPARQPQFPPQQRNAQPYSMLDQLLKEYALPSNGAAPLHDISFGSY